MSNIKQPVPSTAPASAPVSDEQIGAALKSAEGTLDRVALSIGVATTAAKEGEWREAVSMAMGRIRWALSHPAPASAPVEGAEPKDANVYWATVEQAGSLSTVKTDLYCVPFRLAPEASEAPCDCSMCVPAQPALPAAPTDAERTRFNHLREANKHAQPLDGVLSDDTERLDWLETKTVNVRNPLRYGSADMFWASPEDIDGEAPGPNDIRAKIDAARKGEPKP